MIDVLEDQDLFFEAGQDPLDIGPDLRRDVAADAADEDHAVGLAVAGDPLREPHDLLPDPPGLHEDRVEADEVAGDTEPEQVRVEALDLEHDRPDVLGPARDAEAGGGLDGLGVADGMDRAADAADALGDEGHFVVADLCLTELFDAPVSHEAAVVAALDRLAVDVDGEVLGLVEADVERADGHDGRPGRGLVEPIRDVLGGRRLQVVRDLLAQGIDPGRPVVGQDEPLRLGVAGEGHAEQVLVFALGPAGVGDVGGDRVEGRVRGRGRGPQDDHDVVGVEGEGVDEPERPAASDLIIADADHVAAAEPDEGVRGGPQRPAVDVDEEPVRLGRLRAHEVGAEAAPELGLYPGEDVHAHLPTCRSFRRRT